MAQIRQTINKRSSPLKKSPPSRTNKHFWRSLNILPLIVLGAVGAIVAIVIVISHIASNTTDDFIFVKGQDHHSTGLGMSAIYPTGWRIDDKDSKERLIVTLTATAPSASDSQEDDLAMITVFREPVDGDLINTSGKIFADDKALVKKVIREFDLVVGNLPAKAQEYTSTLGHEEDIVVVNSNNVGYFFNFITPEAKWQSLQPALQTFMHTIKFDTK